MKKHNHADAEQHEKAEAEELLFKLESNGDTSSDTFELVYDGPNVSDGTMSARELSEVFAGISRAVSTIAQEREIDDQFELRVKDVASSSFHIIFEAIAYTKAYPGQAAALATGTAVAWNIAKDSVSGLYTVVTDLAKLVEAKKKLRGERANKAKASFSEDGVRVGLAGEDVVLTKEQYEMLISRRIDKQLSQIVSPLSAKRIDRLEIKRDDQSLVYVDAAQRDYFDYVEVTEATVREGTEIRGTLNSLSKTSRRGTFHTMDGVHVPYKYTGGDDAQLLYGFASSEPVVIHGRVKYVGGVPTSIEAEGIDLLQRNFLDSGAS
jgi:hypothetical protein